MAKKKLKHNVIHAGTVYKTLDEVPTDLLSFFDEKGFIVEDVAEAGPADIKAEIEKKDALLLKAEDELIETLSKLEGALKRATDAEGKLAEALEEIDALKAEVEEAEAAEGVLKEALAEMEAKAEAALEKGGKKEKGKA